MPECEFTFPQPDVDDNLPSPEEARIRLTTVRAIRFKLTLTDLATRLTAASSPTGALSLVAEHMAPLLQHILSVATALRDVGSAFDAAHTVLWHADHAQPSTTDLNALTETALADASRAQLSHEDKAHLQAARQRQLDALEYVEHAAARTDAADSAFKRL